MDQNVNIEDVGELMTTIIKTSEMKVWHGGLQTLFDVVSQSDLPIELLEARLRSPLEALLEGDSATHLPVRRIIVELDYKALESNSDRVSFLKATVQTDRSDQFHYAREAVRKLLDLRDTDAGKVIEELKAAAQKRQYVRRYLSVIGGRLAALDRKLDSESPREQIGTIDEELSKTLTKRPYEDELDVYRWLLKRLAKIEGDGAGKVLKYYWKKPKFDIFLSHEVQELLYERGEIADSERTEPFDYAN